MEYIIYCDESVGKGRYFSNFYGGALIEASRREGLETELKEVLGEYTSEMKWTKIGPHNEALYIKFIDKFFDLIMGGFIKYRIMFTQNINEVDRESIDVKNSYFMLYYQFIKHAFGLRFCNPGSKNNINISVYLDDAPDTKEKLNNFRVHLSSLSAFPIFSAAKIQIKKDNITEVKSHHHIILQAVDVVLGSMHFRLNDLHKEKPEGQRLRGKRTRAKERVYKHINKRIREIYPNFNIGTSTGTPHGRPDRWQQPYRHWCFKAKNSTPNLERGKKAGK